jgi:peptidoglycan/LPS O-acetylase OafA/YrhL
MQQNTLAVLPKHNRLLNVDAMRAVCAFAVLLFHYGFRGSFDGFYAPLFASGVSEGLEFGQVGVLIFFCISGFVIAYSSDGRSALQFATSRFARIYPTFVLCLTLLFAVRFLWGGEQFPAITRQYLANFSLLPQIFGQNFLSGVYWSIVVEIGFYAWVFLWMSIGVFQRHRFLIMADWLLLSAVNEWWLQHGAVRFVFITEFAPFFVLGMVLQMTTALRRLTLPLAAIAVAAFALALGVVVNEIREIHSVYEISKPEMISVAVFCFGYLLLVIAVLVPPIASRRVLLWCGGLSYPLYLLHEGLGQVVFVRWRSSLDGPILFVVVTGAAITMASVVWWGFDRWVVPLTRRKLDQLLDKALAS